MTWVAFFFSGALLCNCIPHLAAGLQGARFQTPFAKPPGVGESSALVNVYWGGSNVALGLALCFWSKLQLGLNLETLVFAAGALAVGTHLALHFGKVRHGGAPHP